MTRRMILIVLLLLSSAVAQFDAPAVDNSPETTNLEVIYLTSGPTFEFFGKRYYGVENPCVDLVAINPDNSRHKLSEWCEGKSGFLTTRTVRNVEVPRAARLRLEGPVRNAKVERFGGTGFGFKVGDVQAVGDTIDPVVLLSQEPMISIVLIVSLLFIYLVDIYFLKRR